MIPDRPRPLDTEQTQDAQPAEQHETDSPAQRAPHKQRSLHDNQEHLGIGRDHKTETMRRRRRGTFP